MAHTRLLGLVPAPGPTELFFTTEARLMQRTPPSTGAAQDPTNEDKALEEICQSLDKSRKRNLSPGLLRGGQAVDRLTAQEVSASPLLKKSKLRAPSSMAMTMADFRAYMDQNVNKDLRELKNDLGTVRASISALDDNVKGNSARLDRQESTIRKNQASISEIKAEMQRIKDNPALPTLVPQNPSAPPNVPEAAYQKARRSLWLWPIPGNNQQELWTSARNFLGVNLELEAQLRDGMVEAISRVTIPSGPGVSDEALVLFTDSNVRDMVLGAAAKLAPFRDTMGRPTAGMRIEVPPELQQDFRILFRYGQNLRTRHGLGTRRHVKFDDLTRGLYLNVKLPGDGGWSKVSLDLAKRGLRARDVVEVGNLERRLDINGSPVDRARAASTSFVQPPTTGPLNEGRSGSVSMS